MQAARSRPWTALAVLCLGNFLILLDTSIVNTAMPDMMTALDAGIDEMLWVLNGYLLALAALLIVFGRLGDVLGPRTLFIGGLAAFALASALCGAAASPSYLIAARVVQGVGAAALLPQAITLITAIFPADRRGAAFGIFTAVAGIAAVSGPTLGGLLVSGPGWRWIFLVNVPVAVVGIVAALRLVPDLRPARGHGFDAVGVVLATLGLTAIVYSLIEGERHRWGRVYGPVTIPAVLACGLVLLTAFALWERRRLDPLLPPRLLRERNFGVATVVTMINSFGLYGFLLVFVIETQAVVGMSPLVSGLSALPWTVTLCAVAPVAGRLADRIGGRILLCVGLAAFALGVLGMMAVPVTGSTAAEFAVPLILIGIGMGASIAPATTEAMRGITPDLAGAASGVLNTARQIGAAFGAAIIGAVLQHQLTRSLGQAVAARAAQLPPPARDAFTDAFDHASGSGLQLGSGQHGGLAAPAGLAEPLARQVEQLAAVAFADGFRTAVRPTLAVLAGVLLLGSALALLIKRQTATPSTPTPAAEPATDRIPARP